jgi:hypothetical protein
MRQAALRGALAGVAGVAVMTAGEKLEQRVSGRPNSYVPGRTLLALLGRRPPRTAKPVAANHLMHWGTGAALGALRGVWAASGLRGTRTSLAHTVVRLAADQTLENATGVGAPPWTWPRQEQTVDLLHKAVYSLTTGALADRVIPPMTDSRTGRTSG